MKNNLDKALKSMESIGSALNKSLEEASKHVSLPITPGFITPDTYYKFPEIEIPVNPMIGLAEEQLNETKKLNKQFEDLQGRIKELEEKSELSSKNQWKHDILMAFIGAFFGFVFSLFI